MDKSYLGLLVLLHGVVLAAEQQFSNEQHDSVYGIKTQSRKILAKKEAKAAELKEGYIVYHNSDDNTAIQRIFEPLAVSQMVELMKVSTGEDGKSAADEVLENEARKYVRRTNEHKYGGLSLDLRFIHDGAGLESW